MSKEQVSSPQDIYLRPLTKGMYRDRAASLIKVGGFYTLENYMSQENGIEKRPGYTRFGSSKIIYDFNNTPGDIYDFNNTLPSDIYDFTSTSLATGIDTPDPPIKDLVTIWFINGEKKTVLFDSGGLYLVTSTGVTEIGTDQIQVSGVDNVDFATFVDVLYFTDNVNPVQYYDGSSVGDFDSGKWIAKCMAYHKDRLFIGNVTEVATGSRYRQMIRWTSVAPDTSGDFDNPNFLNLPYTSDELLRIVPLGDLLVLYFENSIWVGRETNIVGDALPFEFARLPTNNVGLVGMKAVVPFTDAHFLIGQDDVYILQIDGSLNRIGSAIFDDLIKPNNFKYNIYASLDQEHKSVVFGIPDDSGANFDKILRYNYTTNAWSYDVFAGTFLSNVNVFSGITIDELTGTIDDLDGTIDNLSGTSSGISLWTGRNGYLLNLDPNEFVDEGEDVIVASFETGDFDLGELNTRKTFTEFSIKIRDNYDQMGSDADRVRISMYASNDKGGSWRQLSDCQIVEGRNEYEVNFRFTGDIVRFRGILDNSQSTYHYTIEEMVVRGKMRGVQGNRE